MQEPSVEASSADEEQKEQPEGYDDEPSVDTCTSSDSSDEGEQPEGYDDQPFSPSSGDDCGYAEGGRGTSASSRRRVSDYVSESDSDSDGYATYDPRSGDREYEGTTPAAYLDDDNSYVAYGGETASSSSSSSTSASVLPRAVNGKDALVEKNERFIRGSEVAEEGLTIDFNTELRAILDSTRAGSRAALMASIHGDHTGEEVEASSTGVALVRLYERFVAEATRSAQTIVSEMRLPAGRKTIRPMDYVDPASLPANHTQKPGAPRRGMAGGQKFMDRGIFFKVVDDVFRIYGGSLSRAGKGASHELRGADRLAACSIDGLNFPLICILDIAGVRLVCTSILPISESTLAVGSADGGRTVMLKSAELLSALTKCADVLKLKVHSVGPKGVCLPLGGDVEGHVGKDGEFYVIDTHRTFPAEALERTVPQAGDMLVRLLRPELVLAFAASEDGEPLSSDAMSNFQSKSTVAMTEERAGNDAAVVRATKFLQVEIIPCLASTLQDQTQSGDPEGGEALIDLFSAVHRAGVNYRHLGAVRRHVLTTKASADQTRLRCLLATAMFARVARSRLRGAWRCHGSELIRQTAAKFLSWIASGACLEEPLAAFRTGDVSFDDALVEAAIEYDGEDVTFYRAIAQRSLFDDVCRYFGPESFSLEERLDPCKLGIDLDVVVAEVCRGGGIELAHDVPHDVPPVETEDKGEFASPTQLRQLLADASSVIRGNAQRRRSSSKLWAREVERLRELDYSLSFVGSEPGASIGFSMIRRQIMCASLPVVRLGQKSDRDVRIRASDVMSCLPVVKDMQMISFVAGITKYAAGLSQRGDTAVQTCNDSIKEWKEAIERAPDDFKAYNNYGITLMQLARKIYEDEDSLTASEAKAQLNIQAVKKLMTGLAIREASERTEETVGSVAGFKYNIAVNLRRIGDHLKVWPQLVTSCRDLPLDPPPESELDLYDYAERLFVEALEGKDTPMTRNALGVCLRDRAIVEFNASPASSAWSSLLARAELEFGHALAQQPDYRFAVRAMAVIKHRMAVLKSRDTFLRAQRESLELSESSWVRSTTLVGASSGCFLELALVRADIVFTCDTVDDLLRQAALVEKTIQDAFLKSEEVGQDSHLSLLVSPVYHECLAGPTIAWLPRC